MIPETVHVATEGGSAGATGPGSISGVPVGGWTSLPFLFVVSSGKTVYPWIGLFLYRISIEANTIGEGF